MTSIITAVGGCFCSTVQKTSNKVRTSIIKRASHGSGAWLKASCSESMHCSKKNIHISNVINTFFLTSGICYSGRWRRTYESHAHLWDMLVSRVCLQEQRKQSFLTLAKENQSPLGLYQNPPTFFFTNPRFVLIHDWLFVLFCFLSALVTNHTTPTSYVIRQNGFRVRQLDEVREMCLLCLKYANAWIHHRRPLFISWSSVKHCFSKLWIN